MTEAMQRRLMMLMCLRCGDVLVTLRDEEIAFALRVSDEELAATKALFVIKKFIDKEWNLLNWEKRQYSTDSSKERTKRWRDKKRDGSVTPRDGHGDRLEQIQNRTDTEEPPIVPQGGPVAVPDPKPKTEKAKQRTAIQQEFEEEWPGYWLKRGKDTAERAYEKARKQATREEIHAGVERMGPVLLREAQERGHSPLHPATWLNRGGWKDEVEPALAVPGTYPVRDGPQYQPDTRPLDQIFLR